MEIPRNLLQPLAIHRFLAEKVYGNRNKNPSADGLIRSDRHLLTGPMYVSFASHFFAFGENRFRTRFPMEIPRNIPQPNAKRRSLAEGVYDRKSATHHAVTLELRCFAATPIRLA